MDTLQYTVGDNALTPDPKDGRAIIQNPDIVDGNMLEAETVEEGTGLTLPQTKAYIEKFYQRIEYHVSRGRTVKLPIATFRPTIQGVFRDMDDTFDPSRHQVVINVTPGPRIRRLEREIRPEKVKGSTPMPEPVHFTDAATGERNRTATPGGIATLKGYLLKFDPADPEQGLFFLPADDPKSAIRVQQFTAIKPSELHFLVPALAAGGYYVEVRAILHKMKTIRTGTLAEIIEVI